MVLFFYLFSILLVLGALCVINTKNAVYSVLWLIFTFCNAAGLMLLLGAEFLSFSLIIVYVGAVAVLFLFVVMMLDIDIRKFKSSSTANMRVSYFLGLLILLDLIFVLSIAFEYMPEKVVGYLGKTNTHAIGQVMYTDFILPFQMAGLVLFVAMIACISLTLKNSNKSKRQDVNLQLSKSKKTNLILTNPKIGAGIEGLKYE
jgi:NADH-quinone oxidoreductase subunit J